MSGAEKRQAKRVAFFCEAQLEGIDVSRANVRIADLSVDGAFVDAMTVLPPGTIAQLRFSVEARELALVAEVRYSMPGMGMGVRFLDVSEADRSALEAIVAERS